MDETKQKLPTYSNERMETTSIQAPAEAARIPESPRTQNTEPSPSPTLMTRLLTFLEPAAAGWPRSLAELPAFLKRTQRVWLSLAGTAIGLMLLVTLVERVYEWARNVRERRQEQAIASLTPDRLIVRCGRAAEDATKEVYPILMRTISYQPRGKQRLIMAFSRTAEEQSDWVFLSMRDANGASSYDTPEAQIAALPCLDSRK